MTTLALLNIDAAGVATAADPLGDIAGATEARSVTGSYDLIVTVNVSRNHAFASRRVL